MTSSDILDTTLAVQMKQAGELILQKLEKVIAVLKETALEYKDTVMVGRSHGVHAEPLTFGFKILVWYSEMLGNRQRLLQAIKTVSVGKISGAVGTFAHLDPFVEEYVCKNLGLEAAAISINLPGSPVHPAVRTGKRHDQTQRRLSTPLRTDENKPSVSGIIVAYLDMEALSAL